MGANKFEARWNGIEAIDGKRVIVQQPSNSGSHYYDYKGNNSIVLLAVIGPDYQCLWASAGTNGRSPDSAIWQNCDLKKALSSCHNSLDLPKPRPLPGRAMPVPYVLTGDDAFALTRLSMKPFPLTGLSREHSGFLITGSHACGESRKIVSVSLRTDGGYFVLQFSRLLTQSSTCFW